MFKVIKEFVPEPMYLMMCDNRNCSMSATGQADLASADGLKLSQSQFLKSATEQGWAIGLDAQLCPAHAEVAKKQREERRSVVVMPSGAEAAQFGRKVPS